MTRRYLNLILGDAIIHLWFRKNICYLIKDMFHYLLLTCLTSVVKYRIAIKCVTLASQIGCTFFRRKCRGKLVLKLWISYLSYRVIYMLIIICIYPRPCFCVHTSLCYLFYRVLLSTLSKPKFYSWFYVTKQR